MVLELVSKTQEHSILPAFTFYLLDTCASYDLGNLTRKVRSLRSEILDVADKEPRIVYKALILSLCGMPIGTELALSPAWRMLWERGLLRVVLRSIGSPEESCFEASVSMRSRWLEGRPWELTDHARNVEFGLGAQLISTGGPDDHLSCIIRKQLSDRLEDEAVSGTSWLLQGCPADIAGPPIYYLWSLLRDTVLRPTYLPWSEEVRREAERGISKEERRRDYDALSA